MSASEEKCRGHSNSRKEKRSSDYYEESLCERNVSNSLEKRHVSKRSPSIDRDSILGSRQDAYLSESPVVTRHEDRSSAPPKNHEPELHRKPHSESPQDRRGSARVARKRRRPSNDETQVNNKFTEGRPNWWEMQSMSKRSRPPGSRGPRFPYEGLSRMHPISAYGEIGNRFPGEGMNSFYPPFVGPSYDMAPYSLGVPWSPIPGVPYDMGVHFRPPVNPNMWLASSHPFPNSWRPNAPRYETSSGHEAAPHAPHESEETHDKFSRSSDKMGETSEHSSTLNSIPPKSTPPDACTPFSQASPDPRFGPAHSYPVPVGYLGWGNTWNRFPDVSPEFMPPHRMVKAFNPSVMYPMMSSQRHFDPRYHFTTPWGPPYLRSANMNNPIQHPVRMCYPTHNVLSRRWAGACPGVRGALMGFPPMRLGMYMDATEHPHLSSGPERSCENSIVDELFSYLDKASSVKNYETWDPYFASVAYSHHLTNVFFPDSDVQDSVSVRREDGHGVGENTKSPVNCSTLPTFSNVESNATTEGTLDTSSKTQNDEMSERIYEGKSSLDKLCHVTLRGNFSCISQSQSKLLQPILLNFSIPRSDERFRIQFEWNLLTPNAFQSRDSHVDGLQATDAPDSAKIENESNEEPKIVSPNDNEHRGLDQQYKTKHPSKETPSSLDSDKSQKELTAIPLVPNVSNRGLPFDDLAFLHSERAHEFISAYFTRLICSSTQFFPCNHSFMASFNVDLASHWFFKSDILGKYTDCISRARHYMFVETNIDSCDELEIYPSYLTPVFCCALDQLDNPTDITRFVMVPCTNRKSTNEALESHLVDIINR